jgi:uncharacterized protein (TIGR03067 family)
LLPSDAKPARGDSDLVKLKGQWKVKSVEGDGTFKWHEIHVGDAVGIDRVSLQPWAPQSIHDYYFVSPLKTPKEFDVTFWVENLFLTQNGIYQLDGDTLTFCVAPYQGARPTKFAAEKGKSTLIVCKRVIPHTAPTEPKETEQ